MMKFKSIFIFLAIAIAVASCTVGEDEPALQVNKVKLVNKKWYLKGKNGQNWFFYKSDGKWENHAGDYGSWTLTNGNVIKVKAEQDLMQTWEDEVLELTDSYLKKKMKGTAIVQEYSTAP